MEQWKRIEIPEINPCIYSQLIFDKSAKNPQWEKDSLFNKRCWENWISMCTRMKLDTYLIPYTKINSKWIKDLNMILETIKLLEENIRKNLYDICLGNNFLDMKPKAQVTRAKIDKCDYIKLKSYTVTETINKMKGYIYTLHI